MNFCITNSVFIPVWKFRTWCMKTILLIPLIPKKKKEQDQFHRIFEENLKVRKENSNCSSWRVGGG